MVSFNLIRNIRSNRNLLLYKNPNSGLGRKRSYRNWKLLVVRYMGGKCYKCGSRINLEIDHIDPKLKKFNPSDMWTYSWSFLTTELKKCQLLCYTCHKTKHASMHGTISMYRHHKCRCDSCVTSWRLKCRAWSKNYKRKLATNSD